MKPYYEHGGITIYHGDCREVMPHLSQPDCFITDPPYPDCHAEIYGFEDGLLENLGIQRGFVFWSAKAPFPLPYSAIHIWDKVVGCGSEYERIFEIGGQRNFKLFRCSLINSPITAKFARDVFWGHPSQKPIRILRQLVGRTVGSILDPFAGTGTTLLAAKEMGRTAIGIERDEHYCEIAARRLSQEILDLGDVA